MKPNSHQPPAEEANPILQWPLGPETPCLEPGRIHLWAAAINEFRDRAQNLERVLSPAERLRAEKFKFVGNRGRFVIRRGLLRLILGRYLKKPPAEIEFQFGAYGKPEVRRGSGMCLFYDASDSDDIAVWAITPACPVGVDVEHIREIPDMQKIARRYFHPRETETLMALATDSRPQAFYACWTRKEAFLKATGEGIAENLARVQVTLAPREPSAIVSLSGDPRGHKEWRLQEFSPCLGYVGCVADRRPVLALCQWRVNSKLE
jgi:4'-phosphopantetheinyl transferase